jgi:lipopolysaccharide/colanic/teichoic acid biosynthesis glycosyltransferase
MTAAKPGSDHDLYDPDLDWLADSGTKSALFERQRWSAPSNRGLDLVRVRDVVIASIALWLLAPVMLVVMILVRLTSRGQAICAHRRAGQFGHAFYLYKLRTSYRRCEWESKFGHALPPTREPCDTPIGRFLRRQQLDELPQLLNVIRGEIGLVGPRPEPPELVDALSVVIPNYHQRLSARPGITGLAQLQSLSGTDRWSARRRLKLDLLYASRASHWLDLRIMIATVGQALGVPDFVLLALVRTSDDSE